LKEYFPHKGTLPIHPIKDLKYIKIKHLGGRERERERETFSVNVKERICLTATLESLSSNWLLTKALSVLARRDCQNLFKIMSTLIL
jgi:hypothetical protein